MRTPEEIRERWYALERFAPEIYRNLIEQHEALAGGKFKNVNGRKVPVEEIVTQGICGDDLDRFPPWEEE